MKKSMRHDLLKQIVQQAKVEKQEDFVKALADRGYEVTQATISRDIKELDFIKVPHEDGGYYYALPQSSEVNQNQKIESHLKDAFVSLDSQNELLLIETIPGNAPALGLMLEEANFPEVFTILSQDDKLLIICRSKEACEQLRREIISYI